MTQGKKLSQEEIDEIVAEVEGGDMLKKDIAAKHHVHPTMISKCIARSVKANPAKRAKKAKRARAVKAAETKDEFREAFDDYIAKRNAANEARKRLTEMVEQLR